jgi:hypothetical protein
MQRAKLFGALFAYVNNIQITWKTIHLSVFCRTNSPSTDQTEQKEIIQNVLERKIQWQSVTNGLRKEHVLRSPFLDKYVLQHFSFLMVICNSLNLLLKSLPINIINCIKFYVNCSALTGTYDWQ